MGTEVLLLVAAILLACGAAGVVSGRGAGSCIRGVLLTGYGAVLAFAVIGRAGGYSSAVQAAGGLFLLSLMGTLVLLASIQVAAGRRGETDASERKRLKG